MKPILVDPALIEEPCQPMLITSPDQALVDDLPAAVTPAGVVISRWHLDEEERARVAAGADLYVWTHTNWRPMQPIALAIGPAAAAHPPDKEP